MISKPRPLKISIITPSFNQGDFLEQTIESVLNQNYDDFEHLVIDGGSSDQTLAILKRYQHLNWLSEVDWGQAHAVNKGLQKATGDVIAWINSDDWYEPGAFSAVAGFFSKYPECGVVMGNCRLVDAKGHVIGMVINKARGFAQLRRYWVPRALPTQPAIFFRRRLLNDYGLLDENLHYAMDYDLWMRFATKHKFYHLNRLVANYRFHSGAKGGDRDWSKFQPEWELVYNRYVSPPIKLLDLLSRLKLKIHKRIFS